jgi:hypothetical protein
MKPILLVLALVIASLTFSVEAAAIVIGPYNVTVNLSEYADIQSTGPDRNSETGLVKYQLDITKGNSTMPSEDAHVPEILVRILRFSTPLGIDDPTTLEAFYRAIEKTSVPPGLDVVRGAIIIDGHEAASWKSSKYNYQHVGYFINNNVFVEIGAFELPTEDMNVVLRTFHVQES